MLAITLYETVKAVHIMAVVVAFGALVAYPIMFSLVLRGEHGGAVMLHRAQGIIGPWVITLGQVVILATGIYLVSEGPWDFGDPWVSGTFAILIVLFALGGAYFAPKERRLVELAREDPGSEAYRALARQVMNVGWLGNVLVLVAIFLMTTKPGA